MIIDEEEQLAKNWADEEPFFNFELAPFGAMAIFEESDQEGVIDLLFNDLLIPTGVLPKDSPQADDVMENLPPQYQGRKLIKLIIPIRYTKVFEA